MVYSGDYDSTYPYGPAFPVVECRIKRIGASEASTTIMAMVDSGADATIFPLYYLKQAGMEPVGRARLRWGNHPGTVYDVYLATIQIGTFQIHGVRILADQQYDEAILGRDVLNHLIVTLNGPGHTVEIWQ